MTTTTIQHFDVLDYVEQSTALGVNENVAKYQARQLEKAIDIAINAARTEIKNKELATKHDIHALKRDMKELELRIEQSIEKSKVQMIIWVAGLLGASGLIQHFFK